MKAETFQDPSELMKRALFRTLLIVAVAVVLYMFCVVSEQTSLQRAKEKKANLSKQLADWKGTVARKAEVKAEYRDISLTVTNKEKLLLERDQVLGDYESTATTLLDPIAKLPVCRFRNPDLNSTNEWKSLEVLLSDKKKEPRRLPLPATAGSLPLKSLPQLYARQPICLTCKGPRNKIITFLCAVEDIAAGGGKTKRWLEQISEAEKQKEEFKQLPKEEREEIEKAMTDDLETLSRMSGKLSGMTLEAFTFKAPQGKDDKWGEAVMVFEWPIKLEKKDGTP